MFSIQYQVDQTNYPKDAVFLHHTGNMFGIGCSAFSKEAVFRVSQCKQRPDAKGFIVLFDSMKSALDYGVHLTNNNEKRTLEQYSPGNLSLVLPIYNDLFSAVSINNTIAIRIPQNQLLRQFIRELGTPIISTSINRSGEDYAKSLPEIQNKYPDWFDFAILPKNHSHFKNVPSTLIEFSQGSIKCLREGIIPFDEVKNSYSHSQILFVCTGNICRSPMAEYLANKLFAYENLPFVARSAGFMESGVPISTNSLITLRDHSIDASKHFSTLIDDNLIRSSWRIVTMTEQHRNQLMIDYPNAIHKIVTLAEFSDENGDVHDPYGLNLQVYQKTYAQIEKRVLTMIHKLKELYV